MNGYKLGINDLEGLTSETFILCFRLHIRNPLKHIIYKHFLLPTIEISRARQFYHIFINVL